MHAIARAETGDDYLAALVAHDPKKIHEIEAMGFSLPLYSKNGWNPFIK